MNDVAKGLNKVNEVLDVLIPLTGKFGLGVAGILAIYRTFRRESGTPDLYPELSLGDMGRLLQAKADELAEAARRDRANLQS